MATEKEIQLVGFRIGRESYGVPIASVREIVRVAEITPVPDAPSHIEGVVNLRGRIIPVIDLRKRFHETQIVAGKKNRILVVESLAAPADTTTAPAAGPVAGRVAGLLVDAASEVLKMPRSAIEPPPEILQQEGLDYITGLGKRGDKLIVLVDLEKLMRRGELSGLSEVAEIQPAVAATLTPPEGAPVFAGGPKRGNGSQHGQR
jgi:purine-binding chemotaxis protein CheW